MERIADCLIISLFYNKSKLIEPDDNFLGISSMIKIRATSKPILIFHQYYGEGEMTDYSSFFKKAMKEFDEKICEWTGTIPMNELRIHENTNEGIYAFDSQKQIIHRLIVPTAELIWKWYNGVLYKIMHNAAIKNQVKPLNICAQESFKATMNDTVKIIDDEELINPVVQCADYLERSWKTLCSFSMTVYAELLPSWLIKAN